MHIVPSIDLREGRVVRLAQGDYARQTTYRVDPVDVARDAADAGAKYLHVVDLDGAKLRRVAQADRVADVARVTRARNITLSVGGGVREVNDVRQLLDAGADRVVIGTRAVHDWPWFERLLAGDDLAGRLILAIDARDGVVATEAWRHDSGVAAADLAARVRGTPLAALLYTDVSRDGMMVGPDVRRTSDLANATDVPVLASGGVGDLSHVAALAAAGGIWGVVIGRALYEGRFTLSDALAAAGGD